MFVMSCVCQSRVCNSTVLLFWHADQLIDSFLRREFEEKLDSLVDSGRKLNAFMFEPHFVIPGLHTPPVPVVKAMVKYVLLFLRQFLKDL